MKEFESILRKQLQELGVGDDLEGFEKTPERFLKTLRELTEFHRNPNSINKQFVFFHTRNKEKLVVVSRISFASLCRHHLLPFFGFVDIGYIPNGKILGFSKFKRIIELMSRQLSVQEDLTQELFDLFMNKMKPLGLIVHVEAKHTCALIRGARDTDSVFHTVVKSNFFDKNPTTLSTFLSLANKNENQ